MANRGWMTGARNAALFAVLLLALCLRGLAEDIGIHIPGLPLSSFAGSSMDNLLAVLFAVVAWFVLKPRRSPGFIQSFGLGAPGWRDPLIVLACTLPFWISSSVTGTLADVDLRALVFTALIFPLAEEVVFRGFGFVFPCLSLRWRPWAACVVQAFAFGAIHWLSLHENGSDAAGMVFCMTFLGGLVFAVLDGLNRNTIWCGLVFHVSLNAAWDVFDESSAAGGWGWVSNALRLVCAALAVAALWMLHRRKATPTSTLT